MCPSMATATPSSSLLFTWLTAPSTHLSLFTPLNLSHRILRSQSPHPQFRLMPLNRIKLLQQKDCMCSNVEEASKVGRIWIYGLAAVWTWVGSFLLLSAFFVEVVSSTEVLNSFFCFKGIQGLFEPVYNVVNEAENIASVLIPCLEEPSAYFFCGEKRDTIPESCHSAAQKMALFLVRQYKVVVRDLNWDLRSNIEKSIQLFKMKTADLEAAENGYPNPTVRYFELIEGLHCGEKTVYVDFLEILRAVIQRFQIGVTPIETLRLNDGSFTSCFNVTRSGYADDLFCLIGDPSDSVGDAKQSMTKIAVTHFMNEYQFHVKDINYHMLDAAKIVLKYERKHYIATKERVYGLVEEEKPMPMVVEQDLLTPRGPGQVIHRTNEPPLPPKKKRCLINGHGCVGPAPTSGPSTLKIRIKRSGSN